MRELEFSEWLRSGGAKSDKAMDGRISSLRRLERNLGALGFKLETLEEIYAQDQFAALLEKLTALRADARDGGLEFRILLPESDAGDRRLSYWQSWLKRYGRFLGGEAAAQAIGNPDLDAFLKRLSREEIDASIEECKELGTDEFLSDHGFGKPRRWILDENGADRYPAKAIVAAAISYLSDGPELTSQMFYQGFGEDKAFAKLAQLGYAITEPVPSPVAGLNRDAVLSSMNECAELGLEEFLDQYAGPLIAPYRGAFSVLVMGGLLGDSPRLGSSAALPHPSQGGRTPSPPPSPAIRHRLTITAMLCVQPKSSHEMPRPDFDRHVPPAPCLRIRRTVRVRWGAEPFVGTQVEHQP